eukprot:jgi/Mesen1/9066/ME000578S08319
MTRLADSIQRLARAQPTLFPGLREELTRGASLLVPDLEGLLQPSIAVAFSKMKALDDLPEGSEATVSILVSRAEQARQLAPPASATSSLGSKELQSRLDVFVYVSTFQAASLSGGGTRAAATVVALGPGRALAQAKFSEWVATRKVLEQCKPADAAEVLLSTDGDALLEGLVTNFFVIAARLPGETGGEPSPAGQDAQSPWKGLELQTASVDAGVLPGVIRHEVLRACERLGLPVRQVAPLWSQRDTWRAAFITNAVRLAQPVGRIRLPVTWRSGIGPDSWAAAPIDWREHTLDEGCFDLVDSIQALIVEQAVESSLASESVAIT